MFFSRKIAARPAGILGLAAASSEAPSKTMTAGDALERHFTEHYDALYRFLRSCGAGEPLAEDLSQEAFLRLHRHLAQGRSEHNIRAWLFRVGYRLWVDRWRAGLREVPVQDGGWDLWSQVLRDPAPNAEQALLAGERQDWLRANMLRLSQVERQALHLRADGLKYREIADVLGIGYWRVVEAVRRALDILGDEAHGQ
jgi:RNA polymerase sigma-70 factor (ECF subfamily)